MARRNITRSGFGRLVAGLLALALLLPACRRRESGLVVSGRIEQDNMHIGSRIGGRVERVASAEGDLVKQGAPIVLLDDRELKAQLEQARASAGQAQAQLDLLLAGTRAEDIARAEASVRTQKAELQLRRSGFRTEEVREAEAQLAAAQSSLTLARRDLNRSEQLFSEGIVPQSDLDTRRNAFHNAEAQVNQASQLLKLRRSGSRPEEIAAAEGQLAVSEADLLRLKNGPRPEEIAAGRAALASAQANIRRLETQLDEMSILAPRDALVETLELKPGDLVRAGDPVAVLNLLNAPYVRCYVPENRLGAVKPGQAVTITIDSYPGRNFPGRIRRVSSEAEFTPRNVQTTEKRSELVFEMKVDVTQGGEQLRAGMYADVHVGGKAGHP